MKNLVLWVLLCVSVNLSAADKDTVYIYGHIYHPPYELKDKNGNVTGLTIDLLKEALRRLNHKYVIKQCDKEETLRDINRHKSSIIAGTVLNDKELNKYHLYIGNTYRYIFRSVITRKDDSIKYTSIFNMRGWRIAMEKGNFSAYIIKKNRIPCKILYYNNIQDAIKSTVYGNTNVTFTDDAQAAAVVAKMSLEDELSVNDAGLAPIRYSMVGNNATLLKQISEKYMEMKSDGTYDSISSKWLKKESSLVYIRIIHYILIVALVMILFIFILRSKVDKAKREIGTRNLSLKLAMNTAGIITWHYDPDKHKFEIYTDLDKKPAIIEGDAILHMIKEKDMIKECIDKMNRRDIDEINEIVEVKDILRHVAPHHCKVTCKAVRDYDRNIISYTGISLDIEDLIQTQLRLEKEKRHAINADRLKSVFLANISHEIRTPLNAIVGFSQLLQHAENTIQRNRFVDIINNNNEQLIRIISDIIEMSKIETKTSDPVFKEFDVYAMLDKIIDEEMILHSESEIHIIEDISPDIGMLYSDKSKIKSAITNIIENAYKFTMTGDIKISVKRDNKFLKIIVADTGIGISDIDKKRIFDSFIKVSSFTTGIGLGLTISKANIDMLGGTISVDSELGKGSVFTVSIPVKYHYV